MSEARAAIVVAGVVTSVVVVDLSASWEPPTGSTAHVLDPGSSVGPGWTLSGDVFSPPTLDPEPAGPVLPTVLGLQSQLDELTDLILMSMEV